jgi:hypothetical protein
MSTQLPPISDTEEHHLLINAADVRMTRLCHHVDGAFFGPGLPYSDHFEGVHNFHLQIVRGE